MTRTRIVRTLSHACIFLLAISLTTGLLSVFDLHVPVQIHAFLFLTLLTVSVTTRIFQFRVELIEREWPLFTFESIHTLYRRFPIRSGIIAALLFALYFAASIGGRVNESIFLVLSAMFVVEYGALRSLLLQPWLLEDLTCPSGHKVRYFNRFCPSCGIVLPKIKGCA